ncbi:hypothetical protein HPP92_017539 [Vanilla planifolia]|uniref:CASP-like protein n=1 Tax=Vanilla planifolia TaxID=51239 RepID=A0A835QCE9_VANPL|nr:hypothetical protein HPP92_017539 [Vanilla planifolia]
MKIVFGTPGTVSGLLLRCAQCLFAGASIGIMAAAVGFSNYTAFCYLIASMGLQLIWSMGISCFDIYTLWTRREIYSPILVSLFAVGDWVTSTLSSAAACSSAGVAVLFVKDTNYCRVNFQLPCGRYGLSIALAFVAWFLTSISSLIMFALLAST